MSRETGIGLIVAAAGLASLAAFLLRTRLPGRVVFGLLAASGAALGTGGLLVQHDVGAPDWVVTVASLAVLVPFHVRVVLGRLGRPPARS